MEGIKSNATAELLEDSRRSLPVVLPAIAVENDGALLNTRVKEKNKIFTTLINTVCYLSTNHLLPSRTTRSRTLTSCAFSKCSHLATLNHRRQLLTPESPVQYNIHGKHTDNEGVYFFKFIRFYLAKHHSTIPLYQSTTFKVCLGLTKQYIIITYH